MNRFLDLSETSGSLTLREGRLRMETEDGREIDIPIADLSVVVFGIAYATISLPALAALSAANVAVVVAGKGGMPTGMMLPIGGHSHIGERIAAQVAASEPRQKAAWAAIVRAKIVAQARALDLAGKDGGPVRGLATNVRSGDPTNLEAQAARRYWTTLLGDDFRRDREQPGVNQLLNYGYGVLRAIVGRAVAAAGLHPSIGLHHHHRGNSYPLVDDLMESFRPVVDLVIVEMVREEPARLTLDVPTKRRLLTGLTRPVHCDGEARTLFDVTQRMTASLASYLQGDESKWAPPVYDPAPLPPHEAPTAADGEADG